MITQDITYGDNLIIQNGNSAQQRAGDNVVFLVHPLSMMFGQSMVRTQPINHCRLHNECLCLLQSNLLCPFVPVGI